MSDPLANLIPKKRGEKPGARRARGHAQATTLLEMINRALTKLGGERYLIQQGGKNPAAFMQLAGKTLTQVTKHSGVIEVGFTDRLAQLRAARDAVLPAAAEAVREGLEQARAGRILDGPEDFAHKPPPPCMGPVRPAAVTIPTKPLTAGPPLLDQRDLDARSEPLEGCLGDPDAPASSVEVRKSVTEDTLSDVEGSSG